MKRFKNLKNTLKKTAFFALALTLSLSIFSSFASASFSGIYDFPSGAAPVKITLDGKSVLEGEAAIIDSVTYVPLRSFAELAGAQNISWNSKTKTASMTFEGREIKITDGGLYVSSEGRFLYTVERILNINDRLFVPIRPFAKALGLEVGWNGQARTVTLTRSSKPFLSGSKFYNSDDLYWLSRIINAEAGGESLEGKLAVGAVVINRKNHSSYPNTIYGVIFDRKGGTQFTPVAIGTIYKTPTEESVIAAKICLEGYILSDRILFFMNPKIATNNWISKNRPYAFTIGNHAFYY